MEIEILGQGFEPISKKSVGNVLIDNFSNKNFNSFTAISAFATLSGINGVSNLISKATHLKKNLVVVGVNEKVTSKEALEELLNIKNTKSYVFFGNNNSIFHPKIYLFEGDKNSILIIGSSNLTGRGLFTNIETSIQVTIDNNIDKDKKVIEQLKEYFNGIFEKTDSNLNIITKELINDLVKSGIVPTEAEQKENLAKSKKLSSEVKDDFISKIFPKRTMAKIPKEFFKKADTKKPAIKLTKFDIKKSKLLWQSGKLTERDLNIPKGTKTNPTGSMHFKKGLNIGIDQRHFFRDIIFRDLIWELNKNSKSTHYERAKAQFKIIVNDIDYGVFILTLKHNTNTKSKTYLQNNSMTSLIWGEAKPIIAKEELIGCNASLYSSENNSNLFTLIIE
jgi:HKD family nuclease